MRRSAITAAASMCVAVPMNVWFFGPANATGSLRSGSAVPSSFHAQSVSWISPDQGWMLGAVQCGTTMCAAVLGTTDGGVTWNKLGPLAAPVTLEKATGVTEVRFADDLHGWAFEPALWATSDGGATWQREAPPGGGHLVLALAGDAAGVYAVVSPCKFGRTCSHPLTFWRTTPGQGSWTQVS